MPASFNRKEIMTAAWAAAREAVRRFGGRASQYISECLKLAWAAARELAAIGRVIDGYASQIGLRQPGSHGMDRFYLNRIRELEDSRQALKAVFALAA